MTIGNRGVPVRLIGVWVFCLAVLVVAHFALVAPRGREVAASQERIEKATERFALLRGARSQHEQDRLAARQQELKDRLAEYIFTGEQLSEFDFELRWLAEKNKLVDFFGRHVRTTSKVGPAQLKKIVQRDMILSFKSTFPEFLLFINDLERNYPVVFVDQFTLRGMTGGGTGLECSLECSLLAQAGK